MSYLEDIERSIFVLSLDKTIPVISSTDQETIHLNQTNHGGGSQMNSGNRWFDKIFQAFVSPDGLIGFNYEHSAAEGPPIVQLVDYSWANLNGDISLSSEENKDLNKPRKLNFYICPDVEQAIVAASKTLIKDLDLIYYNFDKFGKDFVKSQRISPDAFIQVAFQLAHYRLHGYSAPTYESGSLRKFQHGRTDTIRSCSQASDSYCKAMFDDGLSMPEKARLLRKALDAHRSYTDMVINGQGIDRHLLGLKLIAAENGLEIPALFKNPVYEGTCYWKISTSQVPSRAGGLLCFAPVVPDGYGICYNPMDMQFIFSISAWKTCRHTNASAFSSSLERSLVDCRDVLVHAHISKL